MDKETKTVPRDQRRGRKREAASRAGHAKPSRDSAEPRGTVLSTQRAKRVTQRVLEAAQCLRGLMQSSKRLTQRPKGPTQSFRDVGEGFVGQVF